MARIMVVDDEPDARKLIRWILENEKHEVIEAEDGFDCLEKLTGGEKPDLILLDVMMPKMDGWDVSRKIKGNEALKNIPVCILTAKATTMDALMSVESAHADWHLNKPVTKKLLLQTIEWLLNEAKKK